MNTTKHKLQQVVDLLPINLPRHYDRRIPIDGITPNKLVDHESETY